jgi:G3E family GTPase
MSMIPVTLLTGFLGSGKSTLLTKILKDPRFGETAVVVNEFGEIGLDGFLVEHSDDQIMEMMSGCLCCTIRGDIRETLLDLHARRERGEIRPFNRLVIETTGLADPAPVIHTLMSDPRLDRRFMLGGIVTTIDALHGEATLETHSECVKQAAVSDRIVITKSDLISDPFSLKDMDKLKGKLASLNPGAKVFDAHDPEFDLAKLFDTSLYDPETKTMDVRKWLSAEADTDAHDHHHHHGHDHRHEHDHDDAHDITRHGTDIRAFTLTFDNPVSIETIGGALEALTATQGANLLRMKGIVNTTERPDMPLVLHGVQHVFHDPIWLEEWPDDDRRTRLVFITHLIERATLEKFFKVWIKAERGVWN